MSPAGATHVDQWMSESSPWRGLGEADVLTVYPDDPLTVARVLRRLEVLRRRLSVRWCGLVGAFAGYEELDVKDLSWIVDGRVVLEAFLIDADEVSHVVELVATRPADAKAGKMTQGGDVLVHGVGRALQTRGPSKPEAPSASKPGGEATQLRRTA